MAAHFALMTGRLLTEATLRSAIHEAAVVAAAVPSTTTAGYDLSSDVHLDMGSNKAKSGVMVECRICQEEGDEAYMETPCSCKGSLKKFTPNFTAPLKLFRHGRNPTSSRGADESPVNRSASYAQTGDHADGASSFNSQNFDPKGVIYCRVVAIALMALLVLRDAVSLILGSTRVYSMELLTLLMFRTAGIVIPVYIILITVTALLQRCNQQRLYRIQPVHPTLVSEPGGARALQATPPQQHQHIVNIQ